MEAQTHAEDPSYPDASGGPARSADDLRESSRLDIQAAGDCLSLVEHTFGSLPDESLIVIGLLDGFTGGHMRVDLPPALADPFASARLIAECLAGEDSDPAPEAALVVMISKTVPSAAQDALWQACLDSLNLILESEYCVRIVQTWFIAGGYIRDPQCSESRCCDLPGQDVALLQDRPGIPGLPPGTSARRSLHEAAQLFLTQAPPADPELVRRCQHARERQGGASQSSSARTRPPGHRPLQSQGQEAELLLKRWDTTLEELRKDATPPNKDVLVDLLAQLRSATGRDLLIPLATHGFDVARVGVEGVHPGMRRTEPVQDTRLADYAGSFLGETGRRPDWERVDALERLLQQLVPYAQDSERENLLCLMAWIEWARGRGTAAGSFVDLCLEEFPQNQFSQLIERFMQLKGVCQWARVKRHSWSWSRRGGPN